MKISALENRYLREYYETKMEAANRAVRFEHLSHNQKMQIYRMLHYKTWRVKKVLKEIFFSFFKFR